MRAVVLSKTKWHLQPTREQYGEDRLLDGSEYFIVPSIRLFIHTRNTNKSANTLSLKPPHTDKSDSESDGVFWLLTLVGAGQLWPEVGRTVGMENSRTMSDLSQFSCSYPLPQLIPFGE